MFKLDLEKAEEPEIKLPTSAGSSRKQESSRKTSTSALLTMLILDKTDFKNKSFTKEKEEHFKIISQSITNTQ